LRSNYDYDMPWFSLIANYTTSMKVPQGIFNKTEDFPDVAGLAVRIGGAQNQANVTTYDLNTGSVNNYVANNRIMSWSTFANNRNTLDSFSDGIPFVIVDPSPDSNVLYGSAISVTKNFTINENTRIFDGYVNLNAYGALDNALIEVWDGSQWRTVFCSFNFRETPGAPLTTYSVRPDGYGNTPGIIYIGDKLHTGNNKVRITVWDNVYNSLDFDFVGIVDSKIYTAFHPYPSNGIPMHSAVIKQVAQKHTLFPIAPMVVHSV